jgi:transglutaminase-like putative cysteine protease
MATVIYDISHRTLYHYSAPVSQSHHVTHLSPRAIGRQVVRRHSLLIEPAPTSRFDTLDYFGNPTSLLSLEDEHNEFVIHARSTIDVSPRSIIDVGTTSNVERVSEDLMDARRPLDLSVLQFIAPSRHTTPTAEIMDYAAASLQPGRPVLDAAWDLTRRLFRDFTFDNTATDISTPITTVLNKRRGVCQDFSHLALACLRAAKIPARYVSGYVLTRPPLGQAKLKGSDASHAWISVWAPETGWIDFDPTNGSMPQIEHITTAFGRDYDDVSPISGVLLGGGKHTVSVAVDVSEASASITPPQQ